MYRLLLATALLLAAGSAGAQLSQMERRAFEDLLFIGNLTERDLQWPRRDPYARSGLTWNEAAIDRPTEGITSLMQLHREGVGTLASVLRLGCTSVFADRIEQAQPADVSGVEIKGPIPEPLRPTLSRLIATVRDANAGVKQALERLSPEETRSLLESLPQWAADREDVALNFVKQPRLSMPATLALASRVDFSLIRKTAAVFAARIESEMPRLREIGRSTNIPEPILFASGGLRVELYGHGDDRHETLNSNLCIDLGGRDLYTGRYGAGPGYASVLIDLGGNDEYSVPDLSIGAGVLGIGLAYDLGGHDSFQGRSLNFGAGVGGVGAMFKDGGADIYESISMSQGYGMFGVGLLLDSRGDDKLTLRSLGQGAAGPQGLGWLADQAGDDVFRGAKAQGYSSGIAADGVLASGGFGALTDLGGDDLYFGRTLCQAAGDQGGIGSLYDFDGSDTYSALNRCQSYGANGGAAFLFDLGGNDSYSARDGASQANAYSSGVAVLVDRSGDDLYAAKDSHAAVASEGAFALLIDGAGEDRHSGQPGTGISGGLALFVDAAGLDTSGGDSRDGAAVVSGSTSVTYDLEGVGVDDAPVPPELPPAGSVTAPPASEIADLFDRAAGHDGTAFRRLAGIGKPALDWAITNRLATATPTERSLIAALAKWVGPTGLAAVAAKASSANVSEARNAFTIAAELKIEQVRPLLADALKSPQLQVAAASVAGALNATELAPELMTLAAAENPALVLAAIRALRDIKDESSVGTAQVFLTAQSLPLRRAAMELLASFPLTAIPIASGMLTDGDGRRARIGAELLGMVGTPEALRLLKPYLSGGTAGMKISSMLALDGRFTPEGRQKLLALRQDTDPRVRAVAARIDPGR